MSDDDISILAQILQKINVGHFYYFKIESESFWVAFHVSDWWTNSPYRFETDWRGTGEIVPEPEAIQPEWPCTYKYDGVYFIIIIEKCWFMQEMSWRMQVPIFLPALWWDTQGHWMLLRFTVGIYIDLPSSYFPIVDK